MTEKTIDVIGIGNLLKDILLKTTDEELKSTGIEKGIMHLVSEERQKEILNFIHNSEKEVEIGGACPNVIRTLACLGLDVCQVGLVGKDYYGDLYIKRLNELGIKNDLRQDSNGITGTSLILISPDGERTMNTNLGVSRNYTIADIPEEDLKKAKYLFVTGYQWDTENQINAITHALNLAKEFGTKIIFDVADPFCIKRHKETFIEVIKEYTDIVFSNLEEAKMLVDCDDPDDCVNKMAELTKIAVLKCGSKGSIIKTKDELVRIPSNKINVVDTTAAGDMYGGGFIYGVVNGLSLEKCGQMANFTAETVIQQIGARLPENFKELSSKVLN